MKAENEKIIKRYIYLISTGLFRTNKAKQLAQAYFKNVHSKLSKNKLYSVEVSTEEYQGSKSYLIKVESTDCIQEAIFQEISLPESFSNIITYYIWALKTPIRGFHYIKAKVKQIESLTDTFREKIKLILYELFSIFFHLFTYLPLVPITLLIITRPLRKISTLMMLLSMIALTLLAFSFGSDIFLPSIFNVIGRITTQIIDAVPDYQIGFEDLFPVITGTVFAAGISIVAIIIKTLRWLLNWLDRDQNEMYFISGLSYLTDRFYSAEIRDILKNKLLSFNNDPTIERVVIIGEDEGKSSLASYELLASASRQYFCKSVSILSNKLSIAGFPSYPIRTLWLLLEKPDWERFCLSMPDNLTWYNYVSFPSQEYAIKIEKRENMELPIAKRDLLVSGKTKTVSQLQMNRMVSFLQLTD